MPSVIGVNETYNGLEPEY